MLHFNNRTKIVATIGPASKDRETLKKMIHSGMNVARVNASHGNHDLHRETINTVREINKEYGALVPILYDLQGPKLRIGEIENEEVFLQDFQELILTIKECIGDAHRVFVNYEFFVADVNVGDSVLIDDGNIKLKVMSKIDEYTVMTEVRHGGVLSSRKGVNLPNSKISVPSLTEKDLEDLNFAIEIGVEWIGLSFVRDPKDIVELKRLISEKNGTAKVIAKIEKPQAVDNIDEIIEVSDGIMVARGDLGVEMPTETVPLIQKTIVKKCINASKPVIIATQMMESMRDSIRPTRAEASDVGNSVFDAADAVMLSVETAMGKYPVHVVDTMYKIIVTTQKSEDIYHRKLLPVADSPSFISDSICNNAGIMAKHSGAKAILTNTHSGGTAFKISSLRPFSRIYVFTANEAMLTTLSLLWGVKAFYYDDYESSDKTLQDLKEFLKKKGLVVKNDLVVHVASTPLNERGTANTIKLNVIN